MKMQSSLANCGAFAFHNALATLGIQRSPDECEKLCGTSAANGTSTQGLVKAARKIDDLNPVVIREKRRDVALLKLRSAIDDGRPVIISWEVAEPADHWVCVIGRIGTRYLVADSGDNDLVYAKDVAELATKWVDGSTYEGIIL